MQEKEEETFPELNHFSLTSEYLRILISWHAAHGRHGHTGVLWVSGQGVGTSFLQRPLQTERKTLAITWCTGSKYWWNPFPACSLCKYICFMWSRKTWQVWWILCRWGRGKKKTKESTFPSWAEPTLYTYIFPHCRIIIPLSSQYKTISPPVIDFRFWMETWEGVGSWEMEEGRGEAHKKKCGIRGWLNEVKEAKTFRHGRQTLILSGNKPGQLPQQSLGRRLSW